MASAPITLAEAEGERLRALSECTGRTENELLREALDLLTAQLALHDRRALLSQAQGIWKDRDDLPTFSELRSEWDRL